MPDLAVRWSDDPKAVAKLKRQGFLPLHSCPRQLDHQATVAVVQEGGRVVLTFVCVKVEGPRPIARIVDGARVQKGYRLVARPGSIRVPLTPRKLAIRWYAIGQFRYFDAAKWRPLNLSGEWGEGEHLVDGIPYDPSASAIPYEDGIPGKAKDDPESRLVRAYVKWMNAEGRFEHHRMDEADGCTDLFDRRCWRIIEAKANTDRRTMRLAVGQLFDYKRRYRRTPSIGVLLASRPDLADLAFLDACRVAAIWRTPSGRFNDNRSREWC